MNEQTAKIMEYFECPKEVFEKGTDIEVVEKSYFAALEAGSKEGWQPALLLADEYAAEQIQYIKEKGMDRDALIANCGKRGKEILQKRYAEYTEDYEEAGELEEYIGDVDDGDEICHFSGYVSFHDAVCEEDVILLKIPVKEPWELMAWLPMGGWNECPSADEMIEVARYWYELYGAVPATFTHDVIEFYVDDCVDEDVSLELAKEHYAFCPDRVDQGTRTGTISEVAASLEVSNVWYFWWD